MLKKEKKERVIELLKAYPANKKQISILKYELTHPSSVSEEELIESMTFYRGEAQSGGHTPGHVSDRTMAIATQYQEAAEVLNGEVVMEICRELAKLEDETDRIDYYLNLLDPQKAEIIQMHYIKQMSWPQIEAETHLSQRALMNRRNEGVAELAEMYDFLDRVKKGD